jgi:hypothetical protein
MLLKEEKADGKKAGLVSQRRKKVRRNKVRPIKLRRPKKPKKPMGKRDSEGRYGLSGGGLVASAMEVQKPN